MNFGDRFDFDRWAPEGGPEWDHEGRTPAPTISHFGNALQVWAVFQNRALVSVAEAARAFNVEPRRIIEAVEAHAWMFLEGPHDDYTRLAIGHEGE